MADIEIGLCWGTLMQAGLVETIELAGRFGFPTLSVTPHVYRQSLEAGETPQSLRRRMADAGVRVRVIDAITTGLPGLPSEPTKLGGLSIPRDDVGACLSIADALEAPIVNLTHYGGEPPAFDALAEGVGSISRRAAASGVTIVMEFVPGSGFPDLSTAMAIREACGEPNCGILLDTWHLARTGGIVGDIEALPSGAIGAFQLCDRTEPAPGTPYVPLTGRDLPGEGELPLWPIVDAALANNPGLTFELEVFSEELQQLPADAACARVAAAVEAWRGSRTS